MVSANHIVSFFSLKCLNKQAQIFPGEHAHMLPSKARLMFGISDKVCTSTPLNIEPVCNFFDFSDGYIYILDKRWLTSSDIKSFC